MSMSITSYTCSKHFEGYPCSHRQWRHSGHCRFVHGYSRSFTFWFAASELDDLGFVVDFSSLKELEKKLKHQFDHTFLVNSDDPLIEEWERLHSLGAIDLRVMSNVGMESTSKLIWEWANEFLKRVHQGRTCCWKTQASENNHNSAFYESFPTWYNQT